MVFPALALQLGVRASSWSHQRVWLHGEAPRRRGFPCMVRRDRGDRSARHNTWPVSALAQGNKLFRRLGSHCHHHNVLGHTAQSSPSIPQRPGRNLGDTACLMRWGDAAPRQPRGRGWKKILVLQKGSGTLQMGCGEQSLFRSAQVGRRRLVTACSASLVSHS